jgi:hypothetical protein
LNTLFANTTLVVVPLSVELHVGKLISLFVVHVNVTVCDDELTAVLRILPPVPPFAFNVIVFVFAVQLMVEPLAVGVLYPVEQVPLYVHLLPLVLTLHVAAPVPFTHVLHVATVHKFVGLLLFQLGVAHVARFAIVAQFALHDV